LLLDGRARSGLVKQLDQIMAVAVLQTEEWHSRLNLAACGCKSVVLA
jgi:hypothetical protein